MDAGSSMQRMASSFVYAAIGRGLADVTLRPVSSTVSVCVGEGTDREAIASLPKSMQGLLYQQYRAFAGIDPDTPAPQRGEFEISHRGERYLVSVIVSPIAGAAPDEGVTLRITPIMEEAVAA